MYIIYESRQENYYLGAYAREIWVQLIKFVVSLCIDDFVALCHKETEAEEIVWKDGCVKFINNHPKKSLSHHTSQPKLAPHQKTPKFPLPPSENMQSKREQSIKNFEEWRKQKLEYKKIYYEQEFNHPLFIIENYSTNSISLNNNQKQRRVQGLFNMIVGNGNGHGQRLGNRKFGEIGLVVFVHGFKGSEYDLEKASEYLMKYNQQVDVLRIRTIENDIDYTIQEVAIVVATEIKKHILTSLSKYSSISMIGYSLGGIIARACLPHLAAYRQKLNTLITFSSPHLGTYATDNSLVKLGIWYMTRFTKCTVLEQLHTCRDLKTSSKSYMKILSEQEEISWFKKIVLVSCKEDQFVPHLSARIDVEGASINRELVQINREGKNGSANIDEECLLEMQQMSFNIRKHARKIERVQVWFDNRNKKGTLDKLTGRQSHIQFLDNCSFHKWFFSLYAKQL